MNRAKGRLKSIGRGRPLWLALLACMGLDQAWAKDVTISASYRGDPQGHFQNTTPPAVHCASWPGDCRGIETVSMPFNYTKKTEFRAPDIRDRYHMRIPGRRTVTVVGDRNGESHQLTFEIIAFSQRATHPKATNPVFTVYVEGGCTPRKTGGLPAYTDFLWNVTNPQSPDACHSHSTYRPPPEDDGITHFSRMGIAYRLVMPAAARMKQGIYRGQTTFTVGDGGDFDLGNDVTNLDTSSITVNFELDIEHSFVVELPPGAERAVLEPPGGWLNWLGGRGAPDRMHRDLPLRLWSTGPFKVHKYCEYPLGDSCGIRNQAGDEVPVELALSLPPGVEYQGAPARRVNVPSGAAQAVEFGQSIPLDNRPGQLHFSMVQAGVRQIMQSPGTTYQGQVTVVFDADL